MPAHTVDLPTMPSQLPCPNPTCSHNFSAAEVQTAGSLKCPKCGQVFHFRGAAAKVPAPTQPRPAVKPAPVQVAKPYNPPPQSLKPPVVQAVPVAMSVPPAAPAAPNPVAQVSTAVAVMEAPQAAPHAATAAAPEPAQAAPPGHAFAAIAGDAPLVHAGPRRPRGNGKKRALVLAAALLLGSAVVGGGIWAVSTYFIDGGSGGRLRPGSVWNTTIEVRNQKNASEKACRLILPKKTWSTDTDLKQSLGVAVAFKFKDENDPSKVYWCAVQAKDYGFYKPRESELLRVGIERLEQHFGETLETEAKLEPASVGDLQGQKLTFKGQTNSVVWWGDMYVMTQHGIGYWLYVAAPTHDEAREGLGELQTDSTGLVFDTDRRGWREQPPPMDTFRSTGNVVTAKAPEGLFSKQDAKDEDERGLLFLYGRKEKDNRKIAHVLVLTIDKAGDLKQSLGAAKDYVEADKKKEGGEYTLVPLTAADAEQKLDLDADTVAGQPGRTAEFKLMLKDEVKRYVLLAVANRDDKTFVVRCECTWDSRSIWRQDFLDLLRNLTFAELKSEK